MQRRQAQLSVFEEGEIRFEDIPQQAKCKPGWRCIVSETGHGMRFTQEYDRQFVKSGQALLNISQWVLSTTELFV